MVNKNFLRFIYLLERERVKEEGGGAEAERGNLKQTAHLA